jgi:hypothetical protein
MVIEFSSDVKGAKQLQQISFQYEARASTGRIMSTVQLYDFRSQSYATMSTTILNLQDSSVTLDVHNEPDRFVGSSGQVRARLIIEVAWGSVSGWSVLFDQVRWVATPS